MSAASLADARMAEVVALHAFFEAGSRGAGRGISPRCEAAIGAGFLDDLAGRKDATNATRSSSGAAARDGAGPDFRIAILAIARRSGQARMRSCWNTSSNSIVTAGRPAGVDGAFHRRSRGAARRRVAPSAGNLDGSGRRVQGVPGQGGRES